MAATTPANLLGDFQLMNCLFLILPPSTFLSYCVYLHLILNAGTDTELVPTGAMVVTQVPESSITSSPLTKFHLFVELPYDIRVMIWDLFIRQPRYLECAARPKTPLELAHEEAAPEHQRPFSISLCPPADHTFTLLYINGESRDLAKKFLHKFSERNFASVVDCTSTVLYIPNFEFIHPCYRSGSHSILPFNPLLQLAQLRIEHLVINYTTAKDRTRDTLDLQELHKLTHILCQFEIKRLDIIMKFQHKRTGMRPTNVVSWSSYMDFSSSKGYTLASKQREQIASEFPNVQINIVRWEDGDWNGLRLRTKWKRIEVGALDFDLLHDPREDHEIPANENSETDIWGDNYHATVLPLLTFRDRLGGRRSTWVRMLPDEGIGGRAIKRGWRRTMRRI